MSPLFVRQCACGHCFGAFAPKSTAKGLVQGNITAFSKSAKNSAQTGSPRAFAD
jgi:hypothetical protein